MVMSKNHVEEGAVNLKLLPHSAISSNANTINTVIVTLSLPPRSPHHCGHQLLTADAIGSNLTGRKRRLEADPPQPLLPLPIRLWRMNMHLRMIRFPSARRRRRRGFPPACSLSMRSSLHVPSLPSNSAPSHGLPSRPSPALAQVTAARVGAAVLTSIRKLPARDGFRPAIAGTGSRRSCRILHPLGVRPYAL
jgi:hypothetical protein